MIYRANTKNRSMSLLGANRAKRLFLEDFWPKKTIFLCFLQKGKIIMDKNTLINLGVDRLAAITVKLYNDNLRACTESKKQEQIYKMLKQINKAEEEHSHGYACVYTINQLQTAIQFELTKLKKLPSLHRSMLAFLKEQYGIKNKKEFLTKTRSELINIAYECESYELKNRPPYDNRLDTSHPAIMVYTYLNIHFDLRLKELRNLKKKKRPRDISFNEDTLIKLGAPVLASILIDLYNNCVRIYKSHTKYKEEYLAKDNMRQYEWESLFCDGFYATYKTISDLCTKD